MLSEMPEILPNWYTDDVASLRRFASVRLIALDLDGTTVSSSDKSIYETIRKLQQSLRHPRYGVNVTIATGRTYYGTRHLLEQWELSKGIPLILYNGSVVLGNKTDKVLSIKRINPLVLNSVLKICEKYNTPILSYFFGIEDNYLFNIDTCREVVLGWANSLQPNYESNGMLVEWNSYKKYSKVGSPTAILINVENQKSALISIRRQLAQIDCISTTQSGSGFIEIRPQGSNKATALLTAAFAVNVQQKHVLALGDNDNDMEMLSWAGIGIATANASDSAVQSSNFVCRHGVSQAVVEVLRLVKQARRYFPHEDLP